MKNLLFVLCVLFSTLAPSPTFAIVSHSTEKVYTPSVKKTTQSKKELNAIAWVFLGGAAVCLILALTVFTVPVTKLIMSLVGLAFSIVGLAFVFKAQKAKA